jgi:hypothetical protein
MIDPRTADLFQAIFRREGRSLLQYLGDAFPWTKSDELEHLCQLHGLVQEEREATATLGRFLSRNRIPLPYLGAYPQGYTALNFVSLESLVPRLIGAQRRSIAALESDLAQIHDPTARGTVEGYLEIKRRSLKILEAMLPHSAAPIPA